MGYQVSSLTQGKKPWQKEFIDFQFNGKYISEFGLVAVSDGDRHTFAASPDFEDDISEIKGVTGQYYWGTNIKTLKRTFTVATDGMTEADLNAFKSHFIPGRYGRFIESHLAYRYSYCRVAEVVNFTLIPFQKTETFLGQTIKINEYKGEAKITFIWDLPYTYSVENYIEELNDDNRELMLRAIYDNNIPIPTSWNQIGIPSKEAGYLNIGLLNLMRLDDERKIQVNKCFLGGDKTLLWDEEKQASIFSDDNTYTGNEMLVFYNPSQVRTNTWIELKFFPAFTAVNGTNWVPVYYNNIADEINSTTYAHSVSYNTIQSYNRHSISNGLVIFDNSMVDEVFNYCSPNVLYSINRAIQLAYQSYNNTNITIQQLAELLQLEIKHDKVLQWAINVLSLIKTKSYVDEGGNLLKEAKLNENIYLDKYFPVSGTTVLSGASWFAYFNIYMLLFLGKHKEGGSLKIEGEKSSWELNASSVLMTVNFNGEENDTTISYSYNLLDLNNNSVINVYNEKEKSGDMVLSSYLKLDGGDTIDKEGNIASCHFMEFLQGGAIQDVAQARLEYKFTYI